TIWGSRQHFCDGLTRRGFLQIGAFGAGLTLAEMLRLRALAGDRTGSTPNKSAIMIYLPGGPSHMDMYDLKPDAPKELPGELNPHDHNRAGPQNWELMPRQAKLFEKLGVIRSVGSVDEHSDPLVITGYSQAVNRTAGHPSVGSVVSKPRSQGGRNDVP